jgi:hypothetical protein
MVEVALAHVDITRPVVFIRFARAPKTLSEIEICFRFSIVHLEICRFSILTSKRVMMAPFLTFHSVGRIHGIGVCGMVYAHFEHGAKHPKIS